ncbi:MAG: Wzz/FepE/Etk N-terminal domain-containing protein [Lentimicrobiaceae bacterium]|nr:Wzz/FepE/Etk N-terminal domain-containing protein [Lentimicrobiaceae bacterium]
MANNHKENKEFNSTNIIIFILQWQKPLIIVTVFAIVSSVIFSSPFFITPLYRATVVMFPTSSNAISKALLGDNDGNKHDILEFGVEEQTEQMLQMLNSNKIREKIIEKYNLIEHYNLETNSKYKYTKLYKQYDNNIRFRRTEYMAVQITVYDKDPQIAANIANDISDLLDTVKNQIQKDRAQKGFRIVEAEYEKLKSEIKQMEDSLSVLRKLGVNDYETQAEMMNQQLAIELAKGNTSGIKRIQENLDKLAIYGTAYVSLRDALEHEKKQLSLVKTKYDEAKIDAEQILPQKFVVNSAFKAEKNSYPIRWIIVLITTVSSFLMTLLIIIIYDNVKKSEYFKKKEILTLKPENKQGIIISEKDEIISKLPESTPKVVKEPPPKILNNKIEEKISPEVKLPASTLQETITKNSKNYITNLPQNMENYFNNLNLLKILLKWKWHIVVITALAAFLSLFFSSSIFIKPKYKSTAIVYPSNIAPYSDETETEQMLQWLNSKDIMDSVVKKYELIRHYDINVNDKEYYSLLSYFWGKNVNITKTQYASVKIDVMDTDPKTAYDIVYSILDFYNKKVHNIHKIKYDEVVTVCKKQLDDKQKEIDSVENKLHTLRTEYGIIDYGNQTREVARGYLRTVDGNNSSRINTPEVLKLKKNIEQKGGEFVIYNTRIYDLMREYSDLYAQYEKAVKDSKKEFTFSNMVSSPVVADKKAFPKRALILLYTITASLLFSIIGISVVENYRNKKQAIAEM